MERCPLCGRPLSPPQNEHHLIPKSKGGIEKFLMHKVCHDKIHSVFKIPELEKTYNTWEKLKTNPEIQIFVKWINTKPPTYYDRSKRHSRKR